MTAKQPTQHLALYPTGPSPWSPWRTACGREVHDGAVADTPELVTCGVCKRSRHQQEAELAEQVAADSVDEG
jgi:hypothetical protein